MGKSWSLVFSCVLVCSGCCKESGSGTDKPVPDPPTKVTTAETVAPAQPATTPGSIGTDPNRPGRGLDGLPAEIPAPSSRVPTLDEWNAMPWEITVSRSTPLGCETKMVREWLRVSCRGENDRGGKPTGVTITRKGGVQAYEFAKNGVASLVVQVVKGKKHEARFTWTDRTQNLVVDWSDLGPRPSIKFTD